MKATLQPRLPILHHHPHHSYQDPLPLLHLRLAPDEEKDNPGLGRSNRLVITGSSKWV